MNVVRHIVTYNSQTSGTDKLCRAYRQPLQSNTLSGKRLFPCDKLHTYLWCPGFSSQWLLQYSSQFSCWTFQLKKRNSAFWEKLHTLEASLSNTRKVLCLGKSIDVFVSAIDNLEVDDAMLRSLLIAGKVTHACQLMLDNYIWMSSIGLVSVDTKPVVRAATYFWVLTLLLRLTRNVFDLVHIMDASSRQAVVREKSCDNGSALINSRLEMTTSNGCVQHGLLNCVLRRRRQVFVDVAKNILDIPLVLSSLQIGQLSVGLQALFGVISSFLSVLVIWNPSLKLIPS